MSISKLILGTAGLGGQSYGRQSRVVEFNDAVAVVQRAYDLGIRMFDTAPLYGNAEKVIGVARALWSEPVTIWTKNNGNVDMAMESIRCLGHVPKFLMHNWTTGAVGPWYDGVTTYSDSKRFPEVRTVQVDWNLLCQRATSVQKSCKMLIARSVFLQGVLLGEAIPHPDLAEHVVRADEFAKAIGVTTHHLALRAAIEHPAIDAVVVGPTTLAELALCVEAAQKPLPCHVHPALGVLHAMDWRLTDARGFR